MESVNRCLFWLLCVSIACLAESYADSSSGIKHGENTTKVRMLSPNIISGLRLKKSDLQPHQNMFTVENSSKMADLFAEKIIGGYAAPASTYVHVAHIRTIKSDGKVYACSGTILSPTTVLSAAHCFQSDNNGIKVSAAVIRVGALSNRGTTYTVKSIVVLKRYRGVLFGHDVALVTLFKSLSTQFKPIEFPPCSKCFPRSGQKVFAAGFGDTNKMAERQTD